MSLDTDRLALHKERLALYEETGASSLVGAYQRVRKTVERSAKEVEDYPATPYSESNADRLTAQTNALATIGEELRAWHSFLHPCDEV